MTAEAEGGRCNFNFNDPKNDSCTSSMSVHMKLKKLLQAHEIHLDGQQASPAVASASLACSASPAVASASSASSASPAVAEVDVCMHVAN